MATPIIQSVGSVSGAGTPGQGRNDLVKGETVTLSDAEGANVGASYGWVWKDIPIGSAAVIIGPTTATPTFVVDVEGSYWVEAVVNATDSADEILACPLPYTGARIPAFGEETEYDAGGNAKGWHEAVDQWMRAADARVSDPLILDTGTPTTTVTGTHSGVLVAENTGSGGTEEVSLNESGFVSGFVDADAGATAQVTMSGVGGFATGSAYARNAGTAEVVATGDGAFAQGFVKTDGGVARISADEGSFAQGRITDLYAVAPGGSGYITATYGSLARGTVFPLDTTARVAATAFSSIAIGYAGGWFAPVIYTGQILATYWGAFAGGRALGATDNAKIEASGVAAFAWGSSNGGDILASGSAAHATGVSVRSSTLHATGVASFAHGYSNYTGDVLSSGTTSVAIGSARGAGSTLTASGTSAIALGYALRGDVGATANGSFAQGMVSQAAGASGSIYALDKGAHAGGYVKATGVASADITASYKATLARGYAYNGRLLAGALGAFAHGYTYAGNITATNWGAHASGFNYAGAITASAKGSFAHGSVFKYGAYAASITAGGVGAHASGYVYGGSAVRGIVATGHGAHASGYTWEGNITAVGSGSFAHGRAYTIGALTSLISAGGAGASAQGYARAVDQNATISASGVGAFAQGNAYSNDILATGSGALAMGYAKGYVGYTTDSSIYSYGHGAVAIGYARGYGGLAGGTGTAFVASTYPNGRGGIASGSARAYSTAPDNATARVYQSGYWGGFAFGTALAVENGNCKVESNGGMAIGCAGKTNNDGGGVSVVRAVQYGTFAGGHAFGVYGETSTIQADVGGGFCFGTANDGSILSTGTGGWAGGHAGPGTSTISTNQSGGFAFGRALNGYGIYASGVGSLALGRANTANVSVSGAGSMQFGEGVNTVASSLQIGTGWHFKQTDGAFAGLANGQAWKATNDLWVHSGGVSRNLSNVPPASVNACPLPELWNYQNVPALATTTLSATMSQSHDDIVMTRSGSIVGISTRWSAPITDATADSALVKVTKNGVAVALTTSHSSGVNPTKGQTTISAGTVTYIAGDEIGIEVVTLGTFAPVSADVEAWIEVIQ